MSKTVLIAAGGTGGHLFPAQAFADAMRARGWRVVLMTDERGRVYAKDFVADAIEDVPAATINWKNPIKAIRAALKIQAGMRAARARLKAIDPAVVAGFGGYPSLPALSAAIAQKRPMPASTARSMRCSATQGPCWTPRLRRPLPSRGSPSSASRAMRRRACRVAASRSLPKPSRSSICSW